MCFSVPAKARLWGRCNKVWADPSHIELYGLTPLPDQPQICSEWGQRAWDQTWCTPAMTASSKPSCLFHSCVSSGPLGSRPQGELAAQWAIAETPVKDEGEREQEEVGSRSDCSAGVTLVKREAERILTKSFRPLELWASARADGTSLRREVPAPTTMGASQRKRSLGVSSEVAASPWSSLKGHLSHGPPQLPQLCFES